MAPHTRSLGLRAFLALALLLMALILGTHGLQEGWRARQEARGEAARSQQEEAAFRQVEVLFRDLHEDLATRAREIAGDEDVVRAYRRLGGGGEGALLQLLEDQSDVRRTSVEFYDRSGGLVAWEGRSFSPEEAATIAATVSALYTAYLRDEGVRDALAVWHPVRDGAEVVGAVRVLHIIRFRAPVQNQYLRSFRVTDEIARRTGVEVLLQPPAEPSAGRPLYATDGTLLARVQLTPPPPSMLIRAGLRRFIDVKAFWGVLLGGWIVFGAARLYRLQTEAKRGRVAMGAQVFAAFALWSLVWWGLRWALLLLEIPARWQVGKAPLAPLFDPVSFASAFGWGLMRSAGDLLVTAFFVLVFALGVLDLMARRGIGVWRGEEGRAGAAAWLAAGAAVTIGVGAAWGLAALLAQVTRQSILDSTLEYFARTELLPSGLVLVVFCTLLVLTAGLLALGVGLGAVVRQAVLRVTGSTPSTRARFWLWVWGTALFGVLYLFLGAQRVVPWPGAAFFLLLSFGIAWGRPRLAWDSLTLRPILLGVLGLTAILYPMLYKGMDAQRRARMLDAAATLDESTDPRALFALSQVLERAASDPEAQTLLQLPADSTRRVRLDRYAADLTRSTLLGALGAYDVSVQLIDAQGQLAGRYHSGSDPVIDALDLDDFDLLRSMHAERGASGPTVESVTGRRQADRFQFQGIVPLGDAGWITARAEPQPVSQDLATPFPRVLLPAGYSSGVHGSLALALFRDGVLVRGLGRDFGRYRLDDEVQRRLLTQGELWRYEVVRGEPYTTLYRRDAGAILPEPGRPPSGGTRVVAVRVAALTLFDHLFFLLRLTVAGLVVGLPLYGVGLIARYRAGLLPPRRVRFQDRVLNAFLGVGILSVLAVGFVGLQVVTGENERAVQTWLQQHLERVEETLALDAGPGELPYRVLERTPIDSLARRVGLDLNVYLREELVTTSRPALVRDRLIDGRLPSAAYRALVFDGYRFTTTEERVGDFEYTAGFRALPDEQGLPRYVLSVPTLPEQERIEEEQARMVAYLFGALLLLVLVVLATASLLARALTMPVARLRSGLESVARGRFETTIPVTSKDEIGDLVRTFNAMQGQLAESRRQLAQQERQLAWREMARQVAHEIKNPLTPMKLSVQHLRRAFDGLDGDAAPKTGRFAGLFERITTTLIEQVDALARIAGDFSTFARLPTRVLETLDLNKVVEEAARLMQEEEGAEIDLQLCSTPLILMADREELRRIYINLIKNAIQAMQERDERCVEVTTSQDGAYARSTVRDRGTGIAEALRPRIFEPNFSTKTSGTGLGLAITRKAVEDLGGEIGFDTEEGIGTTFWLRLPLAKEE